MDLVDDNSMEMDAPMAAAGAGAGGAVQQNIAAPKRGMNFMKIAAFLAGLGQVYERDTDEGNAEGCAILKEGVGYLGGKHTYDGTSIPGSTGLFNKDDGEVASFWEGIPLVFIAPAFENKTEQMMKFINCPGFEGLKKIYEWVYHVGFLEADGSIWGYLTEVSNPIISMFIGGFTSYHNLLCRDYGFRTENKKKPVKSSQVKKGLGQLLKQDGFLSAFENAVVLKRSQFFTALDVALPSKTVYVKATKVSSISKQITNQLLSHLNYVHGNNYTIDYFRELFNKMIEFEKNLFDKNPEAFNNVKPVPLLFLMYVAGLIGGDGGVGYGECCYQIRIFQSCRPFLLALAEAIREVMGFKDTVSVVESTRPINKQSANERGSFTIAFTKEQSMQLLFTVGVLDYNRRAQYIVAQVAALLDCCGEFRNKKKVMEFLHDLLKLVRRFYPSKGWRWTLVDGFGNVIWIFW